MWSSVKAKAKDCTISRASIIRIIVLVLLVVAVVLVFVLLPIDTIVTEFIAKIRSLGAFGPLLFILAYAACNILFIPGTILNLAAGYIFGLPLGTFIVWCGASLGSTCCFFLGKFLFKYWADWFQSKFKMAGVLNRAISKNALKILLLLRLSPVMPYMVLNYSLSMVEGLAYWQFILPAMVGMIPGVLLYVYLGSIAQDVTSLLDGTATDSPVHDALFIGGLVFTILSVITISIIATREIKKEMKAGPDEETDKEKGPFQQIVPSESSTSIALELTQIETTKPEHQPPLETVALDP